MLLLILCLLAVFKPSECQDDEPFLSKLVNILKVGFRLASTFLNSGQNDFASRIIEKFRIVQEASTGEGGGAENLVSLFARFLGVDSSKIGDYALDGIILLVHLISLALTNNETDKRKRRSSSFTSDFAPFQYIIKQPQVLDLLAQMEDPNIIELILNESVGKLKNYPPEDVECIPLLICKMFPFVKGMQRSLRFFMRRERESGGSCSKNSTIDFDCHEEMLWREADREQRMFFFLPTLDEVISYGDKCDERFPKCEY